MTCRSGESGLGADGVKHRVGHRAVIERADDPPFAVHVKITGHPGDRRADIAGEDRIVRGQFADQAGDILRMDGGRVGFALGESIQVMPRRPIVAERSVEVIAVRLLGNQGIQRLEGGLDVAEHAELERTAIAERLGAQVDLGDARVLGEELPIREIGAQHEQHVGRHHRVVARREAHQARHADIVWIVVLDVLLAAERMHDGRFQPAREFHDLRVRSLATGAAEQRHLATAVQQVRQQVDVTRGRQHGRLGRREPVWRLGRRGF